MEHPSPSKKGSPKKKSDKQSLNDSIASSIASQEDFDQNYNSNYGFDSTYNQPDEHSVGFTNLNDTFYHQNPKINVKLKQ